MAAPDTIVLLHGFWVTPRSWEEWAAHYERRGYRVLAPVRHSRLGVPGGERVEVGWAAAERGVVRQGRRRRSRRRGAVPGPWRGAVPRPWSPVPHRVTDLRRWDS
jgi:hypothetical protein